jgi:hypothetical protein
METFSAVIRFHRGDRPTATARSAVFLGVALVLFLGVLSSSPDLHERMHSHPAVLGGTGHDEGSDSEVGCVVSLFSQGLVLALSVFALLLLGRANLQALADPAGGFVHEGPRYRLLPAQAPPVR